MIRFDFKEMFFDSPKVLRAADKATRRVLSRFGAFVRRTAKSSIRKRKKTSEPGSPPSSHTGTLKRFIFFGYDRGQNSVVIGPARLSRKKDDTPESLEYGGMATVIQGRKRRRKRVRIRPRPYMGPAFEKEKPQLPAMWANSIR